MEGVFSFHDRFGQFFVTIWLSDYWTFALLELRTIKLSDYRVFRQLGFRTIAGVFGLLGLHG